jgi:hypothetical protein
MKNEMQENEVVVSNIDAMSDAVYEALDMLFKQELVAQGKDPNVFWQHWTIKAQYEPIGEIQDETRKV